jgi:hypothetical protein
MHLSLGWRGDKSGVEQLRYSRYSLLQRPLLQDLLATFSIRVGLLMALVYPIRRSELEVEPQVVSNAVSASEVGFGEWVLLIERSCRRPAGAVAPARRSFGSNGCWDSPVFQCIGRTFSSGVVCASAMLRELRFSPQLPIGIVQRLR